MEMMRLRNTSGNWMGDLLRWRILLYPFHHIMASLRIVQNMSYHIASRRGKSITDYSIGVWFALAHLAES
jgi:hypothetical protein